MAETRLARAQRQWLSVLPQARAQGAARIEGAPATGHRAPRAAHAKLQPRPPGELVRELDLVSVELREFFARERLRKAVGEAAIAVVDEPGALGQLSVRFRRGAVRCRRRRNSALRRLPGVGFVAVVARTGLPRFIVRLRLRKAGRSRRPKGIESIVETPAFVGRAHKRAATRLFHILARREADALESSLEEQHAIRLRP